jgi:hypothetical protein
MNGGGLGGDETGRDRHTAVQRYLILPEPEAEGAMSGMTAFMVAVGGTSLVCYLLINRAQNRKARRESAGGDASSMGAGDSSGGGWNLFAGSGSDSFSSHNSSSSSDSGGDSGGGGGDGGGGD